MQEQINLLRIYPNGEHHAETFTLFELRASGCAYFVYFADNPTFAHHNQLVKSGWHPLHYASFVTDCEILHRLGTEELISFSPKPKKQA